MDADGLREVLATDVVAGAKALVGMTLVTPVARVRIVETEAYRGADDPGCHAFGRASMKNPALFGAPGTAYIYRSYGVHWMLNVVALAVGEAAGVLVRAARPLEERADLRLAGPGLLARGLGIGPELNGHDLLDGSAAIRIEAGDAGEGLLVGPRVGLAPGKGEATPWRFVAAEDLAWASRPRRGLVPEKSGVSGDVSLK